MIAIRFDMDVVGPSSAISFGTCPQAAEATHINQLGGAQLTGVGCVGDIPCAFPGISFQLQIPVAALITGMPLAMVPANYLIEFNNEYYSSYKDRRSFL
jgi:hypothetical protein